MTFKAGPWRIRRNFSGFTLIEVLVALALVGLLMGLVISQSGKILQREMRHAAGKLSSTIRYLYNKAASEGVTFRLVLDMDEHKYWVEQAAGPFVLVKEGEEPSIKEENKEGKEAESEEEGAPQVVKPRKVVFTPRESFLLKPVSLPKKVYFKDVYAAHQIDTLDSGKAYIHFFANGMVERAVIHLRDAEDEKRFSLEINPVTGAVKVSRGYQEIEREEE